MNPGLTFRRQKTLSFFATIPRVERGVAVHEARLHVPSLLEVLLPLRRGGSGSDAGGGQPLCGRARLPELLPQPQQILMHHRRSENKDLFFLVGGYQGPLASGPWFHLTFSWSLKEGPCLQVLLLELFPKLDAFRRKCRIQPEASAEPGQKAQPV